MSQGTKYTERQMLDALHYRYRTVTPGRPPRWIVAEQVRLGCGYGGMTFANGTYETRMMRTADFMAQDTWEAKGLKLHGHEVKTTRADWLAELAQPGKAEAIKRYCDYWWLVVPDKNIVRDDLPDGWGLMAFDTTGKLRVMKAVPLESEAHPATFRASLMRAVAKTAVQRHLRAQAPPILS